MHDASERRAISQKKHRAGQWNTRTVRWRNPLLRSIAQFVSFKRNGVDQIARHLFPSSIVLDLGAGNGSYSHWILGRTPCTCVVMDWSSEALNKIIPSRRGTILRVCADAHFLPFKPLAFDALVSVDTLGHCSSVEMILNEMIRVLKGGAPAFLHSECNDYRDRWPDRSLINQLGKDIPAENDGHWGLMRSSELRRLYTQRFILHSFFSPAGLLGWLLGYPDKYNPAFRKARWRILSILTGVMTIIKKIPGVGFIMRFVNILSNRIELFFGINNGGSCFAQVQKPTKG
jgi:ubiquinone/menaquinone biosynthesis C-methylase UbiE